MRIAHIITRLIVGGAQENTFLTALGQLRDYGDDVTLITGPGLGPEGSLVERARAEGIDVRILPESQRSLHPWRDWRCYRKLIAMLRELKPGIVHTHSSKAGILGRAAATKLGIPVVHTIHGASFHYGQSAVTQRIYIAAEKWAARRCDKLISVLDGLKRDFEIILVDDGSTDKTFENMLKARNKDDRDIADLPDRLPHIEAAPPRHVHVGYHQVDSAPAEALKPGLAVIGRDAVIPQAAETN